MRLVNQNSKKKRFEICVFLEMMIINHILVVLSIVCLYAFED